MSRVLLIIGGLILIGIMIGIIRYTKAEVLINKLQGKGVRTIVILGMLGCMMVAVGGCGIFFRTFMPDLEDRIEALITVGVMILLIYILYKVSLHIKSDEYKEFVEKERIRLLEEQEEEEAYEEIEEVDNDDEEEETEEPAGIDFSGEDDDFSEFEEYEKRVRELNGGESPEDTFDEEEEDEYLGDVEKEFTEEVEDAFDEEVRISTDESVTDDILEEGEDLHPERIEGDF